MKSHHNSIFIRTNHHHHYSIFIIFFTTILQVCCFSFRSCSDRICWNHFPSEISHFHLLGVVEEENTATLRQSLQSDPTDGVHQSICRWWRYDEDRLYYHVSISTIHLYYSYLLSISTIHLYYCHYQSSLSISTTTIYPYYPSNLFLTPHTQ